MKLKHHNNISESQVEDALVANLFYLQRLLNLTSDLKLIARQLRLKAREERLDLLLSTGKDLCLIELKVTRFEEKFLNQVLDYKKELINLQNNSELIAGNILVFLLVTEANKKQIESSKQSNVELIIYEPLAILKNYYENLSAIAPFLIKPNDYGVFSLGLINRALVQLSKGETRQNEIAVKVSFKPLHLKFMFICVHLRPILSYSKNGKTITNFIHI